MKFNERMSWFIEKLKFSLPAKWSWSLESVVQYSFIVSERDIRDHTYAWSIRGVVYTVCIIIFIHTWIKKHTFIAHNQVTKIYSWFRCVPLNLIIFIFDSRCCIFLITNILFFREDYLHIFIVSQRHSRVTFIFLFFSSS